VSQTGPARRFDAIVIGAGTNGLVAAAALAREGRRVLVVERSADVGGQSVVREFAPGFSAPSSIDAGWVPPVVTKGLGMTSPPSVKPDISVAVALRDGGFLSLATDAFTAADAIRVRSTRDAERWAPFAHRIRRLATFLSALYQIPAPDVENHSFRELLPLLRVGRQLRGLGRADMSELLRILPMSVQDLLDDTFEWGPLKAAVGVGGVRDTRQGPRSGGTSFILLHYLIGAPVGGVRARAWWRDTPDAFSSAVADVAHRHGVLVRTNAGVARILVRDDAVQGVALSSGEEIGAPVVISTADPARTLLRLIDPVWLDPEFLRAVGNIKFRGCTAVVQYALGDIPRVPGLNNPTQALASVVSLTDNLDALERAYDAAKYGRVSAQPHVEITVPSLRWPTLAPAGRHVLVARVQYAPHHLRGGATWDDDRSDDLAGAVTAAIGRVSPGFASNVLHRAVLTPDDLETRFGLTEGAVTQGELTLDQILFMRPVAGWGRYAMPIAGLYLGGSGTHPGPGVVGGSGWLAAQRVLSDAKAGGKR
jgi:phytoene dehydrogenase-like protein